MSLEHDTPKDEKPLSPRQERFCQEYIKDLNGTQAALRAGYCPGNEDAAAVQASKFLRNTKINARIAELKSEQFKRTMLSADRILEEIARLAMVDIGQAFDDMGQLKPLSEIPEDVRRAMAGVEVNELFDGQGDQKSVIGLAKRVKFYDKTKALELLGKHKKLFTDVIEVDVTDKLAESIMAARKRAGK